MTTGHDVIPVSCNNKVYISFREHQSLFIQNMTLDVSSENIVVSSHVRESKTVLDSGFQAANSGFQMLDSSLSVELGFWIPKAKVSPIPGSGFPYMGRIGHFRVPPASVSKRG